MALPASLPPYQACIRAGVDASHGATVTGVPDWITTTVLGFAAVTAEMSVSVPVGKSMCGLS